MTDVTERRQLEDQLRQQALFDTLTGLPNRTLFLDRLGHAIGRADRHPDAHFAVVFLDLDGFKVVNDSLGHATGDGLLREVAQRLRAGLRSGDTVARLGGDEFAVLLEDVDLASVPDIAHMIQERLAEPYDVDGTTLVVTASAGVALSVLGYARAEDVLRNADIAMYRAKTRVRGSCTIFDPAMRELVMTRMRTETELRLAIEAGDVIPRYQPIVRLDTGQVTALEALARWRKPGGRELLPGDFLSVAEETGLIVPMSRSLVGQVCDQLGGWRVEGVLRTLLPVAVNVSHREFWHADLLGEVTRALDTAGLDPSWLVVEITESVLMDNAEAARVKLRELHAAGLRVHVDDFGTGYSSLEALHRFSIDALKIDRSFVSRLGKDPRSEELIRTIVMMAEGLGLDVIAEGVETVEQQRILVGLGCPRAQGYLFARPMTPERIAAYLPAHQ
jgi:diguanylate cyclase (GGDEF)-like protein